MISTVKKQLLQMMNDGKTDELSLSNLLEGLCSVDDEKSLLCFIEQTFKKIYPLSKQIGCFKISKNDPGLAESLKTHKKCSSSFVRSCQCPKEKYSTQTKYTSPVDVSEKKFFCESGFDVSNSCTARIFQFHSFKESIKDYWLIIIDESDPKINEVELNTLLKHISLTFERIFSRKSTKTSIDGNSTTCSSIESFSANLLLSGELERATDVIQIQQVLNSHLRDITESGSCCILIRADDIQQLICQVVDDSKLQFEIFTSMEEELFSEICNEENESLIKHQLKESEKEKLLKFMGKDVVSLLSVPVIHKSNGKVILYVCLVNKQNQEKFTSRDTKLVNDVMNRTWRILESSLVLQREIKSRQESEAMLQIAKNLFTHLGDVRLLLGEIIQSARNLTSAERCSVFLSDENTNELVATIFDGISTTVDENVKEIRFPITQGIAGLVATTGKTLNISDVYKHPLFYKGVDEATGFRTRSILCFPIKDLKGKVVGVSQLCNKIKGPCFTSYDVEIAEKFSVFSGISIFHCLLYKQVLESDARSKLANELMLYHMDVDPMELHKYIKLVHDLESLSKISADFSSFSFKPRNLTCDVQIAACVLMYDELGLTNRFHIPRRTLVHFMLMVRKGYRDTPYHNWNHGFGVMHHAFTLIKNINLSSLFTEVDIIALLTAAVCHDLDHRGTNNSFQTSSRSVLADLYSSEGSVLERHHLAQTMCILNSAGCNIFENMSHSEFKQTIDRIKHAILATDVASHLQIIPQLQKMSQSDKSKDLVYSLCMTACDLSDSTKDWQTTTSTSELVYQEFFSQGDLEKRMGNVPAVTNDRDKACLPELQINFMVHIAEPAYKLMAQFFPGYSPVYENFMRNLQWWRVVLRHTQHSDVIIPNSQLFEYITSEEFWRILQQSEE